MGDSQEKHSLNEVRLAWRRALLDAPLASQAVIGRAIAHSKEPQRITFGDVLLGLAFSTALSLVIAFSTASYFDTTPESGDVSTYLLNDQIGELFNG